ncbi:MAG: hypothetical protein L0387_38620 [Acidobacteria bacterium]|nr:hypothetical protein [Acidobacteriota bacterium]
MPRMIIVMGPPGSGKSTLFDERYFRDRDIAYLSGDLIARNMKAQLWQHDASVVRLVDSITRQYREVIISKFTPSGQTDQAIAQFRERAGRHLGSANWERDQGLIRLANLKFADQFFEQLSRGASFAVESANLDLDSLRHMVDQANGRGFGSEMSFICVDDVRLAYARILERVLKGGHHVEPEIVQNLYDRSIRNLPAAIELLDRVTAWDNSSPSGPRMAFESESHDLKSLALTSSPWMRRAFEHSRFACLLDREPELNRPKAIEISPGDLDSHPPFQQRDCLSHEPD